VLVSYTDSGADARQAALSLAEELGNAGVVVVEATRAHDGRWYNLTGCEGECCPVEGTPFVDATHPLTAQLVVDGHPVPLADRAALEASLFGGAADLVDLDEAAARMLTVVDGGCVRLGEEGRWIQRRAREFCADGIRLGDSDAARLIAATARIDLRDVAWAEMTRANASGHVDLWADLVRRTRQQDAAPVAALLAFAAWLAGNGALSWCAVEHSRRSDPAYSFARLIAQSPRRRRSSFGVESALATGGGFVIPVVRAGPAHRPKSSTSASLRPRGA
jgi:hypothetical protein